MRSMKLITSAQNEQLKHLFRLLTQAKARRESGETVLEGVHLLQTYLQSGGTPKQVYLPEKKQQHSEIQEIMAQLDEGLITWVGNEALSKITSLTDADDVMTWIDIPKQAGLPSHGDCVDIGAGTRPRQCRHDFAQRGGGRSQANRVRQ